VKTGEGSRFPPSDVADRWESVGFWLLLLTLVAIPLSESGKNILFSLGLVPWLVVAWRRREAAPGAVAALWAGFVGASLLSSVNAAFPAQALRGVVDQLRILVLFLAVSVLVQDPRRKITVFWTFVGSAALASIVAMGVGEKTQGRLEVLSLGAFDQSSYFLSFALLMAVAFAFFRGKGRERATAVLVAVPIAAAMALSFTRLSLAAAVVGFVFLAFRIRLPRRWRWGMAGAILALLVVLIVFGSTAERLLPRSDFVTSVGSAAEERITRWYYALIAFKENWFLGYGLKHYQYIDFGKYGADTTHLFNNAHNQFVNVLVELGLLGFAFFSALLGGFLHVLWTQAKWRRYAPGTEAFGAGAEAVWIALVITGMGNVVFQFENGLAIAVCMGLSWCPKNMREPVD
jgi:O-antigen ligase